MPSLRNHEGELTIDNLAGPGVSAEFVRASGKDAPIVGEGQLFESATVQCCHCGTVVVLNPDRQKPRGYCRRCDHYVCDNPVCNANCTPFMKTLEEMQNQAYHREASGLYVPVRR